MTSTSAEAKDTLRTTAEFVDALGRTPYPFDAVLRSVVHYQWKHNPALRRYWESKGFAPSDTMRPEDVPAVPTDVFRFAKLVSEEAPARYVFRTSGTTSGARGEHHHISTDAYDRGALKQFQDTVLQGRTRCHFIHVAFDPASSPDSSLSHMLRLFSEHFGEDSRSHAFYVDANGLRADALDQRLQAAEAEGAPIILFGTAFGLADALDHVRATRQHPDSLVIQTGGFKGRREALAPDAFYQALADHVGVPPGSVLAEYGMTELSSQLYSDLTQPASTALEAANRLLIAPPWCRVDAVDPNTLALVPQGNVGLLRFTDLANVDSVVTIQTSDLGVIHPSGVQLLGRAPGATPRGCSLAIEEIRRQQHPHEDHGQS